MKCFHQAANSLRVVMAFNSSSLVKVRSLVRWPWFVAGCVSLLIGGLYLATTDLTGAHLMTSEKESASVGR